ncbi:MAG: glycoside hydrolase family 127 protein [Saprospiraceae bacterium]
MKTNIIPTLLTTCLCALVALPLKSQDRQDYPIQPIPFSKVDLQDEFWSKKIKTNHDVTIPIAIQKSKETGRIDNFKIAGGLQEGQFCSEYPFDDSDVYKIIEAASYSLQVYPDKKMETELDTLIMYIGAAQEDDGYLYTTRTIGKNVHEWAGTKRWEMVHELSHELYNLGHMYEAAVAHFTATGKRNFLDIAIKSADLVDAEFGPGKIEDVPGHQEIEIGLVKLYRATKEERYLNLAKFFLDIRGREGVGNPKKYDQSHLPVTQQSEAVGHAVRGAYMWTAMADIAAITGDQAYMNAIDRIWHDVVDGKYYINGGIGATNHGEAFGDAYQLPNMSAYCETCASVGNAFWNHRMFLMTGDSKYIDVLERSMYNNILDGVSLSGDHFFYPNPLASYGQHERQEWFGCACCPPNVARFLPSMPGYIYAQQDTQVYVNLYVSSTTGFDIGGKTMYIRQESEFPWNGKVEMEVVADEPMGVKLNLRVPGYVRNRPVPSDLYTYADSLTKPIEMKINGRAYPFTIDDKGYITIEHNWQKLNKIQLNFPFEVRKVKANELVMEDKGKIAVERGPLLFCAEWPDNMYNKVLSLVLDQREELKAKRSNILGGTYIIKGKARMAAKRLDGKVMLSQSNPITLIPYYLWNNRGPGEMAVWLPIDTAYAQPEPAPTLARTSKVSASVDSKAVIALNDQRMPENSNDHTIPYLHWWPKKATSEWVQFDLAKPTLVSKVKVYWYDDGPDGGCRIPASWKVQYRMGEQWVDAIPTDEYTITKDAWDSVSFNPLTTDALRVVVQLPEEYATGMYEVVIE